MKIRKSAVMAFAFFALVLAFLALTAAAGTPLICHPFEIGNAGTLPWGSRGNPGGWNNPNKDYNTRLLADDTLAFLADGTPVIVRMETLRRAAVYSTRDPRSGKELLLRLERRIDQRDKGNASALHEFDYGYLVETMKQMARVEQSPQGISPGGLIDGYAWVRRALLTRGPDPEMEFAAALITAWPRRSEHQEHFRKAVAGAERDSLLARNLLIHFSALGSNLAELRRSGNRP